MKRFIVIIILFLTSCELASDNGVDPIRTEVHQSNNNGGAGEGNGGTPPSPPPKKDKKE